MFKNISFRLSFSLLLLSAFFFSCKKDKTDQAAIDRGIIQEYLRDHSLTADSTASGLYYIITEPGSGAAPTATSYVTAFYKGYFTNGDVFDETGATTASFQMAGVIKGWQEGLPFIRKGGKITLLIPSALGYGEQGRGDVPANAVLIFDIELVDVQ
jgi:FKBP-type peptidyl-prolyl cis-trans isomerase